MFLPTDFFFFFNLAVPGLNWSMWDLIPWPGIEPGLSLFGAWSLSHWTNQGSHPTGFELPTLIYRYLLGTRHCIGTEHISYLSLNLQHFTQHMVNLVSCNFMRRGSWHWVAEHYVLAFMWGILTDIFHLNLPSNSELLCLFVQLMKLRSYRLMPNWKGRSISTQPNSCLFLH